MLTTKTPNTVRKPTLCATPVRRWLWGVDSENWGVDKVYYSVVLWNTMKLPDGEHTIEDKIYVVKDGEVVEIKEVEKEPTEEVVEEEMSTEEVAIKRYKVVEPCFFFFGRFKRVIVILLKRREYGRQDFLAHPLHRICPFVIRRRPVVRKDVTRT